MRFTKSLLSTVFLMAITTSCLKVNQVAVEQPKTIKETVLTKEKRNTYTVDTIIQCLKEGNNRYRTNTKTIRNYPILIEQSSKEQYPEAFILSCIDSRVPVEEVFDKSIGDLFVGRVAGNVIDEDILGSMEYGCKVNGSKLIIILGHDDCGAIKSAIDNVELGNITTLLNKIKPAIEQTTTIGKRTSKNKELLNEVCRNNVMLSIKTVRDKSPILKEMEDKGEIKIIGAVYNINSGEVEFI